jgi:arylsulfatase A-like enzyme
LTDTPAKNKASHYTALLERNGKPEQTTGYLTTVLGAECASFIRRHKDDSWYLFTSFNAPHTPLEATPELIERVKAIPDEQRRTYAAMVAGMDDAIGGILAALRESGLDDRTLVFFLSDNGGPLDRNGSDNTPLAGQKGMVLDGGIRVPFLLRWCGVVPAGTTYRRPVSSLDILPTALAAAGARSVAAKPLDGVDLVPFITGKVSGDPHEFLFWRVLPRQIWAVRSGDDKVTQQKFSAPRLFDLSKDLAEQNDLTAERPERASELRAAWDKWAATLSQPSWGMDEGSGKPMKGAKPKPARKSRDTSE